MTDSNGWQEWQEHVLAELARLGEKSDCVDGKVTELRIEVARLAERVTLRATFVGFMAGLVPVTVLVLLKVLR